MRKLLFVVVGFVVFISAMKHPDARIAPPEATSSLFKAPNVQGEMSDADYQKIITITSTLKAGWQRSALEAIPRVIRQHGGYIDKVADEFGLIPHFLAATVVVESLGDPHAVSRKGARGCAQIMPATEKDLATRGDPSDCRTNIRQSAEYLAQIRDRYNIKDTSMMFAAYVDGPMRVQSYTRENLAHHEYLKKILFVVFHIHRMHKTYVR